MTSIIKTIVASSTLRVAEYFHERLMHDTRFGKNTNMTEVTAKALSQTLLDHGETGHTTNGYFVTIDSLAVMMQSLVKEHPSEISDGSHTFAELYDHRCALFLCLIALINQNGAQEFGIKRTWYSKLHDDGTSMEGYLVVGIETSYGQVTYHLPEHPYLEMLSTIGADALEKAPPYDGHKPKDVLDRLIWTFLSTNKRL